MSRRPEIPERISSLLPQDRKRKIDQLSQRKVSAVSMISIDSSVGDFIEAKIEDLEAAYDLGHAQLESYEDAVTDGQITQKMYEEITAAIPSRKKLDDIQEHLHVLKKKRKFVVDELEEIPRAELATDAYTNLMIARMEAACAQAPRTGTKINASNFRRNCLEYYGCQRVDKDGKNKQQFCMLTGVWYAVTEHKGNKETVVKTAHIVARSLEGLDVGYLFGVTHGENVLSAANNSLLLHRIIEGALDTGDIVFYPEVREGKLWAWKCAVINKDILTDTVTDRGVKWEDLDGKSLEFPNGNRPALRYMYFRYVMTVLIRKKQEPNEADWTLNLPTKGFMFATPGRWLRESMLRELARRVSDHRFPEELFTQHTFADLLYDKTELKDEPYLVASLSRKISENLELKGKQEGQSEDSDFDLNEGD